MTTMMTYRVSSLHPVSSHAWTIQSAVEATARHYGVATEQLLARGRRLPIAHWRQVAMYIARGSMTASLPEIGRFFGRDHTTVLHGIREVQREIDWGVPETMLTVARIVESLQLAEAAE